MTSLPVKALVLAAGLGTRLKPLTDHLPKPLFPFFGPSLLGLALWRIHHHGFRSVAVNTHHLAAQVARHLKEYAPFFADLRISHEEELLGTGGALIPLAQWLGDDHVLIYNGDTISTVDLDKLVVDHFQSGAVATMVLLPNYEEGTNPVWTNGNRVTAIGGEKKGVPATFTGIHILSPRLRERLPKDPIFHHIIDAYQEALTEGELIGVHWHNGLWADLGTPRDYWRSLETFAKDYTDAQDAALGLSACNKWLGEPYSFYFKTTHPNINAPVSLPRGRMLPKKQIVGPFAFLNDLPETATNDSLSHCALLGTFPEDGIPPSTQPRIILGNLVVHVPV